MSESDAFTKLMKRVRSGEAEAAAELIRLYETELRVIIRARLRDQRLRRTLESMDICQSVLGNFFVRAAAGQFDLESSEQLVKLLGQMIRNKVTDHARRATADRRDVGRLHAEDAGELPLTAGDTPSQIVAANELAARFRLQLTADEQAILTQRQQGATWEELAKERQTTPEALRKAYQRAVDRAAQAAGLLADSES